MIQWIALALAADAESKAARAKSIADNANRNSVHESALVIVRPVDLVEKPVREAKGFWDGLFIETKEVLSDRPWATLSLKKSDILNMREYQDGDGKKFVRLAISEYADVKRGNSTMIGLYVPGTVEEVSAILDGRA